jgi:hypothetical protein
MKLSGCLLLAVLAVFGLGGFASPSLRAQGMTNSAQATTNSTPKHHAPASEAAAALPIPVPATPERKSPVSLFRELLAMEPGERQNALAGRTPENRRLILAKVREYESLKPDVRELRLRATELRWYLWPLMHMAPADRAVRLQQFPADDRAMVLARLREWDKLPAEVQKQLLENEATIRYFAEVQDNRPRALSEEQKRKLQAGIEQWQALPEEERGRMVSRFNQFFGLTSDEKDKALKTLSEPERQQIEKTLRAFGQLPPPQRVQCIKSFEKFASLSVQERQQFLKNAERWKRMTPAERQAWRDLVSTMQLMPVNLNVVRPPPAPTPPVRHRNQPVATNAGVPGPMPAGR